MLGAKIKGWMSETLYIEAFLEIVVRVDLALSPLIGLGSGNQPESEEELSVT